MTEPGISHQEVIGMCLRNCYRPWLGQGTLCDDVLHCGAEVGKQQACQLKS
jgi:hypothetical protein